MTSVVIIGAGGHAAELDEYIQFTQETTGHKAFEVAGFIDDNQENYVKYKFSAPLLGDIKSHKILGVSKYMIGIANLAFRKNIVERFKAEGAQFVTFKHVSAYVSPTAEIGEGSIVGPNANIGPNVEIGKFTLINSRASLGHDTKIGDYNFISPNVCFSGYSSVGDENLFGINSATIPDIKVGNRNKIAAGMIIDKNLGDDSIVFHRFKEKVFAKPRS